MNSTLLIGQSEARVLLSKNLDLHQVSHAILITGQAGIGKKSWGSALAQALFCKDREGVESCQVCDPCRRFLSGNHPEYFIVKPDGRNIKIDQIRNLREKFFLLGGNKVCLIEQAETMTAEASSSMLKILEEPPDRLYFILLSEQPGKIIDTILSRCQRYTLQPLSRTEIIELLQDRTNVSEEHAYLMAGISGGIPGYALNLAHNEDFANRFEEAKTLVSNLASGRDSVRQLISWAATLAEREDLISFLELLCMIFRDSIVRLFIKNERFTANPDQTSSGLDNLTPDILEETILLINETANQLAETNVNRRLLIEKMLIITQGRLSRCQQ